MGDLYSTLSEIADQRLAADRLERYFVNVAKLLLLQNRLVAGKIAYQIIEVEFYFHSHDSHPDPYAHSSQYPNSVKLKQSVVGSWYFHRFTKIHNYTHTRRGIDLTFGNGEMEQYGGILIRTIKREEDDHVISGPSRVVAELISAVNDPDEIEKMAFDLDGGIAFDEKSGLHLKTLEKPLTSTIYCSQRFGLGDKNLEYREKHYRFFTTLSAIRKQKGFKYSTVAM